MRGGGKKGEKIEDCKWTNRDFVTYDLCFIQSQKKTQSNVFESPRAMAKLVKEAKRVKQVLSANTDHHAQV